MNEERSSSAFLLPELAAIGDAVCHMLQLGVEEEILGESILSRVQSLIQQGRVTSGDVVRLALLTDALRVAEEAIMADETISDVEVEYTLPLVQATAKRLSAFREYYAHMREATSDHVREFLETHRPDRHLFGGACTNTHWLGLDIVRRVAQETGDRDPLDHYSELMVRLAEEIVVLEGRRGPADRVRHDIEATVGLRKLLVQAQKTSAEERIDPRISAFCSSNGPEVFHAIAHSNQIWRKDPFDVDNVHQETRALFSRLLDRAAEQRDSGTGRVLLVLGEAGSGKTHLMRAFRDRAHGQRSGYVGYLQMSTAANDYGRYVLVHLLESLEKPYDEPGVQDSGLMCLSDALLMAPVSITPDQRRKLREDELSEEQLCTLVFKLADQVVSDPRFSDLNIDLLRALLFLQRREPPIYARVLKYLRCEPMGKRDLATLGDLAPKTEPDEPLRLITQLGKLIARVDGGALVFLFDQLEDLSNQDHTKERFSRAMDVVRAICDQVPNALIVVASLRDFYQEMKASLTRAVIDRVEHDPEPQILLVSRSLNEIEAMVERRLIHLYETQGTRHRPDQPYFPYTKSFLERLGTLSARDALGELRDMQNRCILAGHLLEMTTSLSIAPIVAPTAPPLSLLWSEHRTNESARAEIPDDDETLLELLRASLAAANAELPEGVNLTIARGPGGLTLTPPDRGEGQKSVLVQMTNKSGRGGALGKQLEALVKAAASAKVAPVAVRCSDFGGGAGSTVAKQLGAVLRAKGRKLVIDNGEIRTLLAYRSFYDRHKGDPVFAFWARQERPLLTLESVRVLLGLPGLPAGGVDTFTSADDPARKPSQIMAPVVVSKSADTSVTLPAIIHTRADSNNQNGPLRLGTTLSIQGKPALLDAEHLKRHAAFLGASGSGKTSLALNVIEQLVMRGVGAVLIDRKGDLATYADAQMWSTQDPDADRQRRKQELQAQAHVRLFTPGNPNGRPLRIRAVPDGLAALPPHERAQIAQFAAQGLGAMMGYKGTGTELTHLAILAKSIEVLGQLSEKQEVTLRKLIELLAEEDESLIAEIGHLDPKLFKKLVTHLETLRLNHGALLESNDELLRAETLLGQDGSIPKGKVPITVISTKFLGDSERVDFWISRLLVELSRWCSRSPAKHLQSVLFLDEADLYMPATSKPATKEPLQDLLKRARSAGLGVMLATQNPGDLDYKGRDNIGTWWIGRVASKTAIEKMKPLLSECRTDVSAALATATVGEFFQVSESNVVRMRSDRALMETVQLTEERILSLAASKQRDVG